MNSFNLFQQLPESRVRGVMIDLASNASTRFAALADCFDAGTRRHLMNRGVAAGWHCLEVGGGGGTIATWLSERIGPHGRVVVTDIDTRFLEPLKRPNIEVLRHDITSDPLAEGVFDLIHTRMILIHLPERDVVLRRLAAALKPGEPAENHIAFWQVDEDHPGMNQIEHPFGQWIARNIVPQDFDIRTFQRFKESRIDVGHDDATSSANLVAEPVRDRSTPAAHLQAVPSRRDAAGHQMSPGARIEAVGKGGEPRR